MSRWPRGEAQIEQLIATKQLQQVIGGQANGAHLLQKASRTLETAGQIADEDPDSAYVLAYDAARSAAPGGLFCQGGQISIQSSGVAQQLVTVGTRHQHGTGGLPGDIRLGQRLGIEVNGAGKVCALTGAVGGFLQGLPGWSGIGHAILLRIPLFMCEKFSYSPKKRGISNIFDYIRTDILT